MGQTSLYCSPELAKSIKKRRHELNLTIEEAALKAGVGTKTWSRYESGGSIRQDKCKGLCKALNWYHLPGEDQFDVNPTLDIEEYRNHESWSNFLEQEFGELAALSFVIGSDILLDHITDDLQELAAKPKGSHIGELNISWLQSSLPPQFLMMYDYEFIYILRATIIQLCSKVKSPFVANSVIEELALYLVTEESRFLIESSILCTENSEIEDQENWDAWIFDIFDDIDLLTFLYSENYLTDERSYHFNNWLKHQFYCDN